MKILCAEYNEAGEAGIIPLGDDVLLRNNGNFYIPEFTREVSCVPQLVVRLCKLGKSVSEHFAGRYYEEIGVGIRFYADTLAEELQKKALPVGIASSYDGSAAISVLVPKEGRMQWEMKVNGKTVGCAEKQTWPVPIERLISLASDFHTLKIEDFLFCGSRCRYTGLQPDDRIQMFFNDKLLLNFKIK